MRPYWKGYLKLALVSCPIALHAACSTSERITFRQINKATGHRLRQQLIDEETCEPVPPEQKGRGYEIAKGQYLLVEDEEFDRIQIESTHVIDIENIPRQSRGLYLRSRSKRLFGVANAAPVEVSRLKAAKEFTGAATTVLTLLMISYFLRIAIFISM